MKSVRQAVSDAQNMVGQDIGEVTVAFGGGEVTSVRSKGMVSLGRTPRPVMRLDIERVIDAAQADGAADGEAPAPADEPADAPAETPAPADGEENR